MLTDKYLDGVPEGSRASQDKSLSTDLLTDEAIGHMRTLNEHRRAAAARPWRRWPWPGRCAIRG